MTAEKSANTHFSYVQTEISTFKWQRFEWKGGGAGLGGEGAVVTHSLTQFASHSPDIQRIRALGK